MNAVGDGDLLLVSYFEVDFPGRTDKPRREYVLTIRK
jgi:hypothetical protein